MRFETDLPERGNLRPEGLGVEVLWRYDCRGSAYAAEQVEQEIIIGGSTWIRTQTDFTEETRNSLGEVRLVRHEEFARRIELPSMVNAIVPLMEDSSVFVGCKRGLRAFNLFTPKLEGITWQDDRLGGGIYNAMPHPVTGDIAVVTRNGWLQAINRHELSITDAIQLNQGVKLWGLAVREDGIMAAGDYEGNLYLVDAQFGLIRCFHLPELVVDEVPELRRRWSPSIWGITVLPDGQIVASTRWGQITWFDGNSFKPVQTIVLDEEISQIANLDSNKELLVGTRSGKLLYLNGFEIYQLLEIPPARQNDNSIWSISVAETYVLVVFSDGQIVKLSKPGCFW